MRVEGCVLVLLDGWMVVRFVVVTRVPLCARVSCVRPVCVPAPPGVFLPVPYRFTRAIVFPSSPSSFYRERAAMTSHPSVGVCTIRTKLDRRGSDEVAALDVASAV